MKIKKRKKRRTRAQKMALGARLLSFALMQMASANTETAPAPEPFALLAEDIKLLRLRAFIRAICGDRSGLVIAGEPSEQQLADCLDKLKLQYYDACGNAAALASNRRQMHIAGYAAHLNRVRMNMQGIK